MAAQKTSEATLSESEVFSHQNRKGIRYYLHEGKTKTGKPRYFFAKRVRDGAIAQLPDGYEVSESINAVVSVRRHDPGRVLISASDLQAVWDELRQHEHLRGYEARADKAEIIIYEPCPSPAEDAGMSHRLNFRGGFNTRAAMARARYSPVMKFVQESDGYIVRRMTYRGHGGWSYPLSRGALRELVRKYVPSLGTTALFEMY